MRGEPSFPPRHSSLSLSHLLCVRSGLIILAASQYSYLKGCSNGVCFIMKLLTQHAGIYLLWPSAQQTCSFYLLLLQSNGLYRLFLAYMQILLVLVSLCYSVAFSLHSVTFSLFFNTLQSTNDKSRLLCMRSKSSALNQSDSSISVV